MFYEQIMESVAYLKEKIKMEVDIAIILGSGLSAVTESLTDEIRIPFMDIPHFPKSQIQGHNYQLVAGKLHGKKVIVLEGRYHYYEGYTMRQVAYPVYVAKMLGASLLIITNACGAINENYKPGDLMLIDDFINTVGTNPLIGDNDERLGPRFCDMSQPYDLAIIDEVKNIAQELDILIHQGVYALFQGPYYETKAEIRMLKTLGADVVGMSSVPETIVANYLGMKVLGISCITNMATGLRKGKHSHEEVCMIAKQTSDKMIKLLAAYIAKAK
ncbi:MAG: purine-nucleoside phosphorylase [Erysipelotrichaceae bacterium]|nr:purine-nucleoside phosphorylase [Erysipelotrichaceae bacterium]